MGCREVSPKETLVRIVRGPDGPAVDHRARAPGRGAYVHRATSCVRRALRGDALFRALRVGPDRAWAASLVEELAGDPAEGCEAVAAKR